MAQAWRQAHDHWLLPWGQGRFLSGVCQVRAPTWVPSDESVSLWTASWNCKLSTAVSPQPGTLNILPFRLDSKTCWQRTRRLTSSTFWSRKYFDSKTRKQDSWLTSARRTLITLWMAGMLRSRGAVLGINLGDCSLLQNLLVENKLLFVSLRIFTKIGLLL